MTKGPFKTWLETAADGASRSIVDSIISDIAAFNRETAERDKALVDAGASDNERRAAYEEILTRYTGKNKNRALVGALLGGIGIGIVLAPLATATFLGLAFIALAILQARAAFGDEAAAKRSEEVAEVLAEVKDGAKAVGASGEVLAAASDAAVVEKTLAKFDTKNPLLLELLRDAAAKEMPTHLLIVRLYAAIKDINGQDDIVANDVDIVKKLVASIKKLTALRGTPLTDAEKILDAAVGLVDAGAAPASFADEVEAQLFYMEDRGRPAKNSKRAKTSKPKESSPGDVKETPEEPAKEQSKESPASAVEEPESSQKEPAPSKWKGRLDKRRAQRNI